MGVQLPFVVRIILIIPWLWSNQRSQYLFNNLSFKMTKFLSWSQVYLFENAWTSCDITLSIVDHKSVTSLLTLLSLIVQHRYSRRYLDLVLDFPKGKIYRRFLQVCSQFQIWVKRNTFRYFKEYQLSHCVERVLNCVFKKQSSLFRIQPIYLSSYSRSMSAFVIFHRPRVHRRRGHSKLYLSQSMSSFQLSVYTGTGLTGHKYDVDLLWRNDDTVILPTYIMAFQDETMPQTTKSKYNCSCLILGY